MFFELELLEQILQSFVEEFVVLELEQVGQDRQLGLVEDVDFDWQVLDAVGQVPVRFVAHHLLDVSLFFGLVARVDQVVVRVFLDAGV